MARVPDRAERARPVSLRESRPLAEQVRTHILEAILDGRFTGRLPAEGELARTLEVSRTTLRTALSGLERDGIVTRRRAVGTTINAHVSPTTLALQRHVGFDWVLRRSGYDVEVAVTAAVGAPPEDAAAAFGLDGRADHLTLYRSYLADGALALWARDVVPLGSLPGNLPGGELPSSIDEIARTLGRRPVDHSVAHIEAAVKRNSNTELPLPDGRPFIRLRETHHHADARPFGFSILDIDGAFLRLELFRRGSA
jgi:GntR family transcriptional regulator